MLFRIVFCSILPAATMLAAAMLSAPASADDLADFYKGKQMKMIIRSGPGGGYDQYARMLGKHIGKHIPGNPTVLPVNMPGGGGITAANNVAFVAPKDGTILTIASQGLPMDQALGLNPSFIADLRTFNWIGNMSDSIQDLLNAPSNFFPFIDERNEMHLLNKLHVSYLKPFD